MRLLHGLIGVTAGLSLPAAAVSPSFGGPVFWVLFLACVALLLRSRGSLPELSRTQWRWMLLAAILPLLLNIGSVLLLKLSARHVSWLPISAALVIALGIAIARPSADWILSVCAALAAWLVAVSTLYSIYGLEHLRPSLAMNALLYGKIAVIAMLIIAWAMRRTSDTRQWTLLALSLVAGLCALLLSGYRGGLFALPVIIYALLVRSPNVIASLASPIKPSFNRLGLIGVTLASLLMIVSFTPMERFTKAAVEIENYQRGEIGFSSVGSRLAMWKAATDMFLEHPLRGVGAKQYPEALVKLQKAGRYPTDARLFRHAHNSYLNIAAEYGVIGLLAMALVIVALWQTLAGLTPEYRHLGRLLLVTWMVLALTNDLFAHQSILRLIGLGFALCVGLGLRSGRKT